MSTAVLIVNLGTPEAPTAPALRKYLKQFLSDPRVVEIPRPIWWLILNGIILNVRPKKSARKYAQIWTADGSPLKVHTERQAKLLRGALGQAGHPDIPVAWAMRYGDPAVATMLDKLQAEGAKRILIVPLYPQYAASTTASTFDAVAGWLKRRRDLPELQLVRDYHDQPGYIGALAQSVLDHWMAHGRPDDSYRLVMSFHGLPKRCTDLGDPYQSQCLATGRLLAEALGLAEQQYAITFQSRFGAAEWLQPYTQPTLEQFARNGVKRIDVICPGFAADCLETLEEIALECRDAYLEAGGGEFRYIPCLNERADWIAALTQLVLHRLGR
jgi:protoporphyrin/coproporphyrin ferrochelatase